MATQNPSTNLEKAGGSSGKVVPYLHWVVEDVLRWRANVAGRVCFEGSAAAMGGRGARGLYASDMGCVYLVAIFVVWTCAYAYTLPVGAIERQQRVEGCIHLHMER